jgi:hypothetical protein
VVAFVDAQEAVIWPMPASPVTKPEAGMRSGSVDVAGVVWISWAMPLGPGERSRRSMPRRAASSSVPTVLEPVPLLAQLLFPVPVLGFRGRFRAGSRPRLAQCHEAVRHDELETVEAVPRSLPLGHNVEAGRTDRRQLGKSSIRWCFGLPTHPRVPARVRMTREAG